VVKLTCEDRGGLVKKFFIFIVFFFDTVQYPLEYSAGNLSCKCVVDLQNNGGDTPLIIAVRKGDSKVVKTLLGYSVNLDIKNFRGRTALLEAVEASNIKIAEMLLRFGASSLVEDNTGKTVKHLFLAQQNNLQEKEKKKQLAYIEKKCKRFNKILKRK